MDVLVAHNPRGFLHASTCDHPPGFGEGFTRVMEGQGCTVQRFTAAAYEVWRQRQHASRAVDESPAPAPEYESTLEPAQHAPEQPSGLNAPAVGAELVHPHLGWVTVSHHIELCGQQVAVATGPRGSGLVRQQECRLATPEDRPRWMQPEPPAQVVPAPAAPPPPPPQACRMVSLFEGLT